MIEVWDSIGPANYWMPKGRHQYRAYYDPARREVFMVRLNKKTGECQNFLGPFPLGPEGFADFRDEWSHPDGSDKWKKRAPITEHQAGILYDVGWQENYFHHGGDRAAIALSKRGLPCKGGKTLGFYTPGAWETAVDMFGTERYWQDPSYWVDRDSPLVQWVVRPILDSDEWADLR